MKVLAQSPPMAQTLLEEERLYDQPKGRLRRRLLAQLKLVHFAMLLASGVFTKTGVQVCGGELAVG